MNMKISLRSRTAILMAILVAACIDEFPMEPDREVFIKQSEESPWPASLFVQDVDTLEIDLTDSEGNDITGLHVEWRSSDTRILEVLKLAPDGGDFRDSLTFQLRALATAHKRGTVEVTVTIDRPGFEPRTEGDSITVEEHWVSIAAGSDHTCAVTIDDDVYCWGNGFLGNGSAAGSLVPVQVRGDLKFSSVTAGSGHSCGIAGDGTVYCWGTNNFGAMGDGSNPGQSQLSPVAISLERTFESVSAGVDYVCGVTPDAIGYCWGRNGERQLGDDGRDDFNHFDPPFYVCGGLVPCSLTPRPVQTTHFEVSKAIKDSVDLTGVAAGRHHSCGVRVDAVAVCWGTSLALGNPVTDPSIGTDSAVVVVDSLRFSMVTAGFDHTCAITTSHDAYCWGSNADGQLGINRPITEQAQCNVGGSTIEDCSKEPLLVADSHKYTTLSAWGSASCGITTNANLYCWGLEPPPRSTIHPKPVQIQVPGDSVVVSVSVGRDHVCAVTSQGASYCWGDGSLGQLGNNGTGRHSTPQRVHEPQ